jgi:hypothetical protein
MGERRSYSRKLTVNGREITEVVVDPYYEKKHPDISDELILKLVEYLNGKLFAPSERKEDWEFFMLDRVPHEGRLYRLVWCMQDSCLFIGVINCFRRD